MFNRPKNPGDNQISLNCTLGHRLLPTHLDRLLDRPFTKQASLEIDRWLAYIAIEGVER